MKNKDFGMITLEMVEVKLKAKYLIDVFDKKVLERIRKNEQLQEKRKR